jgi:hypothetical protein
LEIEEDVEVVVVHHAAEEASEIEAGAVDSAPQEEEVVTEVEEAEVLLEEVAEGALAAGVAEVALVLEPEF